MAVLIPIVGGGIHPTRLLHGTPTLRGVNAILRNGLTPHDPYLNGRPDPEPVAVYLTSALRTARLHTGRRGRVLVVDISGLPLLWAPDQPSFFLCSNPIAPERISQLSDHPRLVRSLGQGSLKRLYEGTP